MYSFESNPYYWSSLNQGPPVGMQTQAFPSNANSRMNALGQTVPNFGRVANSIFSQESASSPTNQVGAFAKAAPALSIAGGAAQAISGGVGVYNRFQDMNNIAKTNINPLTTFLGDDQGQFIAPENPFKKGAGLNAGLEDSAKFASAGAAIGSGIAPGIGTAIGAGIGALAGIGTGIASGIKNTQNRKEFGKKIDRARGIYNRAQAEFEQNALDQIRDRAIQQYYTI